MPTRTSVGGAGSALAVCLLVVCAVAPAAEAQGWPGVFDHTQLLTLNLSLDPGDWATVQADDTFSIEVPAQFWADGEAPISVGVRRKDAETLNYGTPFDKVSLRVDFNEYVVGQEWNDLKKISLENGDDQDVLREGLAWQIYRLASGTYGFGYPAARAAWVRLIVNGVDTGVYVNPEFRDKRFFENRDLYVPGATWLYEVESAGQTVAQVGAPPDSPTLEALCYPPFADVPSCPVPDLAAELPQLVDMQGLLTIMAAGAFVADNDALISAGKNFYFADFDTGGLKRRYYPWDMDAAPPGRTSESIYAPQRVSEFIALLDVPEFREQYSRIHNDLVCGPWSESSLLALLDSLEPVLGAALDADLNSQLDGGAADNFDALRSWISARVAHVLGEIENFEPCPTVQLRLNEVMASNSTTLEDPDEPGEFPDWFEIYNPSAETVDIGGVYVSDDPLEPTKYQIPAGETIPAGGYYLMYADDDGTQGPQHTNFKIGASGSTLHLHDRDGVLELDAVVLGPQTTDVAFGRYPDGSGPLDFLPAPTPGGPNEPHNPPPVIDGTERAIEWPGPGEAVTVSASATDDSALAAVTLHVDDGAGVTPIPMDALGGDLYAATIPGLPADTIVRYWLTARDELGAQTRDPRPAPAVAYAYKVGHVPPPLVVNEFMASNATAVEDPDEPTAFEDWIEIYNGGHVPVSLGGMYVTDSLDAPTKHALAEDLVVPAGGRLLLWADGEPFQGSAHLGFRLTAAGEEIGLFDTDANGNVRVDAVAFGVQVSDVSAGRCPDGFAAIGPLAEASPGAANAGTAGCGGALVALYGVAAGGGEIRVTIAGVVVVVPTVAGQTAEDVAAAVAAAIVADPTLSALGVAASSLGPRVAVTAAVELVESTDPGIALEAPDTDADGVVDPLDNCPAVTNVLQVDLDLDGVGDACDNCPATPNAAQFNADGDLHGDGCDNCRDVINDAQDDFDLDRRGDACDNCVFAPNAAQTDRDADGEGDRCDLDDGVIYVFFDDPGYVEWQPEAGFVAWNRYRGDLAVLRDAGVYTQSPGSNAVAARTCDLADPWLADADPPAGVTAFYLATGDGPGGEGSLGTDSAGVERPNTAPCP